MKCALYIRASIDNAMGIISEHYQKELLHKTIQEKGWSIYQCYIDLLPQPAINGSSLQKMIKDAEEKKFDVILTTSFTRLARNRKLLNTLSGIQIITLEERKTDAK